MFNAEHLIDLLIMGWLSNVPLAVGSIVSITVFVDKLRKFRGLEGQSRALANQVIQKLAEPDLPGALSLCQESTLPVADMLLETLRWQNIALEDYDRVLSTLRADLSGEMRKGIWMIGTVGSLAPFVGLFGTVIGIIRAFAEMAKGGGGGFSVVAASLSEALIATAAGLGVAIVALSLFNYLNVRVAGLSATYARAGERLVQAILYLESRGGGSAAPRAGS